jgi:hypothetical protein
MEELMRGGELMSFFDILMGGKFIAMKGGGGQWFVAPVSGEEGGGLLDDTI